MARPHRRLYGAITLFTLAAATVPAVSAADEWRTLFPAAKLGPGGPDAGATLRVDIGDSGFGGDIANPRRPLNVLGKYLRDFADCPKDATEWRAVLLLYLDDQPKPLDPIPDHAAKALDEAYNRLEKGKTPGQRVPFSKTVLPVAAGTPCFDQLRIPTNIEIVFYNVSSRPVSLKIPKATDDTPPSTLTRVIPIGGDTRVSLRTWMKNIVKAIPETSWGKGNEQAGLAEFSMAFIPDDVEVTRKNGYLAFVGTGEPDAPERSVVSTMSVASKRTPLTDPLTGLQADQVSATPFFPDDAASALGFKARLSVDQSLGRYAEAKIGLSVRSGDFGDQKADVKADTFSLTLRSASGWTAEFGRFTSLLKPMEGISLFEKGDAARLSYGKVSLSALARRPWTVDAKPERNDNLAWLLNGREILLSPFNGTASFYWMRGRERQAVEPSETSDGVLPHRYWTAGIATSLPVPLRSRCGGKPCAAASYRTTLSLRGGASWASRSLIGTRPENSTLAGDARGSAYFGQATISRFPWDEKTAPATMQTLVLTWARGSGDNPNTTDLDEGYLGETAAFAPDSLFLGGAAPAFLKRTITEKDTADKVLKAATYERLLRPGLSGKTYIRAQLTVPWSPFEGLFSFFGETASKPATTFSVHRYVNNRGRRYAGTTKEVYEGLAGHELAISFYAVAPTGVEWTASAARFRPGGDLVKEFPHLFWTASLQVSVKVP